MDIAFHLKNHRKLNNLSQKEVANATGISQQALSTWENNTKIPTSDKCAILADFYGIIIDELIGHEIKKNW